jgi:hypothetical protein
MEYTKLGRSGLDVSRICLGCMSYGGGNLGNHGLAVSKKLMPASRAFLMNGRLSSSGRLQAAPLVPRDRELSKARWI